MTRHERSGTSQRQTTTRSEYELTRPVFFVGFMGAGKTTVSRVIARKYGLASIDLDSYIERQEGCSISEIFARRGEAGFRKIETEVLRKFAHGDSMLVSCGGGIIVTPENRDILRDKCVVFLKTTAAQAKERISDLSSRPLFNELEQAERRNLERQPLYEEVATCTIDVVGKSKGRTSSEVARNLFQLGALTKKPKTGPKGSNELTQK